MAPAAAGLGRAHRRQRRTRHPESTLTSTARRCGCDATPLRHPHAVDGSTPHAGLLAFRRGDRHMLGQHRRRPVALPGGRLPLVLGSGRRRHRCRSTPLPGGHLVTPGSTYCRLPARAAGASHNNRRIAMRFKHSASVMALAFDHTVGRVRRDDARAVASTTPRFGEGNLDAAGPSPTSRARTTPDVVASRSSTSGTPSTPTRR